jgi:hypothetical protein
MPDCIVERAGHAMLLPFLDPLFMAAASGSAACVRLLLDAGADLGRYPDGEEQPLSASGSLGSWRRCWPQEPIRATTRAGGAARSRAWRGTRR